MMSTKTLTSLMVTLLGVLAGTAATASDWRLLKVNDDAARGVAELRILPDGSFSGGTGCNRFSGKGGYSDGVLSVDAPLASTRAACGDPALDSQEQALFALLQGPVSVEYDPFLEQLGLKANDQTALLEINSGSTNEGFPAVFGAQTVVVTGLTGLLNLRSEPTTSSEVVARLQPDSDHASLGCERREDRDWCRLSLESGTIGWAAAEYLDPLTLGRRAKSGNYDEIGRLVCFERDGQKPERCEYGASLEGGHAIFSIFVDQGEPVVLHFHDGRFDPLASLGPFSDADGDPQEIGESVRVSVRGYTLDVPSIALGR